MSLVATCGGTGAPGAVRGPRQHLRMHTEARIDEELRGEGPADPVRTGHEGWAVELILANSPQAKGRVERRHGVFQDRLVKATAAPGDIRTLERRTSIWTRSFLPDLNRRFRSRRRDGAICTARSPPGVQLKDVLCFEEPAWFRTTGRCAGETAASRSTHSMKCSIWPGTDHHRARTAGWKRRSVCGAGSVLTTSTAGTANARGDSKPVDLYDPRESSPDHPWRNELRCWDGDRRDGPRGEAPPATPPGPPSPGQQGDISIESRRGHF